MQYITIFGPIIVASIALIGGTLGYFLKDFLDRKKELTSENIKILRESYQAFVENVVKLFKSTKENNSENAINEVIKGIYDFYAKYLLYASPELVQAFGNFMQFSYKIEEQKDPKQMIKLLSNVIKVMRSDLGLSNNGLGENGEEIFRALIKDYDQQIK